MKNRNILLILCTLSFFLMQSCQKVDETPEASDPIYADLKKELELSVKQEADMRIQATNDIKQFKEAPPQTGVYTMYRNKMSASENLLNTAQQQKKFFEIKIEQRKLEVRARYRESLKKDGRPWPDPKEIEDYKIRMKLQHDKFQWDTKNVTRGTEEKNRDPKARPGEAPKKAAPPAKAEH